MNKLQKFINCDNLNNNRHLSISTLRNYRQLPYHSNYRLSMAISFGSQCWSSTTLTGSQINIEISAHNFVPPNFTKRKGCQQTQHQSTEKSLRSVTLYVYSFRLFTYCINSHEIHLKTSFQLLQLWTLNCLEYIAQRFSAVRGPLPGGCYCIF